MKRFDISFALNGFFNLLFVTYSIIFQKDILLRKEGFDRINTLLLYILVNWVVKYFVSKFL